MIDTHTHLYSEEFDEDFDAVISRATAAGVDRFIFPATESATFERMMKAQARYPQQIFTAIGLHPTSVTAENCNAELAFVENTIDKYPFVAVGEIGMDCYWSRENIEQQRLVFERQLELANDRNLPVIIHARNAFDEIFAILDRRKDLKNLRGVFHAFAGTLDDYRKIKTYGNFIFGIGGILTFKNGGIAPIVEQMQMTEIVLETDSPYLTPAPSRGRRNESANVAIIAKKIAEIKNLSFDEVAAATTKNAEQMFFNS